MIDTSVTNLRNLLQALPPYSRELVILKWLLLTQIVVTDVVLTNIQ